MAKTIQSKGELWLPQDKFDNRDSSNTLEEGVEYNIIDSVGYATAKYVDDKVSTKTSVTVNGSNVATFDADSKQNRINFDSPLYSSNDNVGLNYGTGLTVDSCNGGLRLDLSASSPISVYDNYIQLDYGNGLTTDGSSLTISTGSGLTVENGYLEFSSNVLDSGFNSSTGSYIIDNYGNIDINAHDSLSLYSGGNIIIAPNITSYKTVITSGNETGKSLGIVLDDSYETITMGTLSDLSGEVDKTKPYIEITKTAVNIKGLNQVS